jgi:hypothetical protein
MQTLVLDIEKNMIVRAHSTDTPTSSPILIRLLMSILGNEEELDIFLDIIVFHMRQTMYRCPKIIGELANVRIIETTEILNVHPIEIQFRKIFANVMEMLIIMRESIEKDITTSIEGILALEIAP